MSEASDNLGFIGKLELCKILGWSRPRLDRVLDRDQNFPVHSRGTRKGGWLFNPAEVQRYLGSEKTQSVATPNTTYPIVTPEHTEHLGERTARQRRDLAQAAIMEAKVLQAQGSLVKADDLRETLGFMLHNLAKAMDALPDRLLKKLNVSADKMRLIRDEIDGMRRAMVNDLRALLADPE
jgi:hypothetical protein